MTHVATTDRARPSTAPASAPATAPTSKAVAAAMAFAIASGAATLATPAQAAENEKCYGVAKAGKNDCQTASTSCAGTSKTDGQADAWIFVPKGTCDKIVGGSHDAG